jgi:transposase
VPVAPGLLERLPPASACAADAAYDSDRFRRFLAARGTRAAIPNNPTRKRRWTVDAALYRARNLVERMFCRLKDFRRVATRYDKLATNYAAAVALAMLVIWWIN